MPFNRILLIAVFLNLTGSVVFAQNNKLYFEHFGSENGLSRNSVNHILQDHKGFLWFATWDGLNKYDGYKFVVYRPSLTDTNSLSNREIIVLLEDSEKLLWIGTSSGLNKFNPKTQDFTRYQFPKRIISMYEDHDKQLWIGTREGGLYKFDRETGEKTHYLGNEIVSSILEDSNKNFWIGTYNDLLKFDKKKGGATIVRRISHDNYISYNVITSIIEYSKNVLFVGTWGGGLNKLTIGGNRGLSFSHYKNNPRNNYSISSNNVLIVKKDALQNLWIGTHGGGLCKLERSEVNKTDPNDAKFINYKHNPSSQFSLGDNVVSCLLIDNNGVLWASGEKLDKAVSWNNGIVHYNANPYVEGYAKENIITSIFEDNNNNLWVGTFSSGLNVFAKEKGQYVYKSNIEKIPADESKNVYMSNHVPSISADKTGTIWVGTIDGGLNKLSAWNKKTNEFKFITYRNNPEDTGSISGNKITSIIQSKCNEKNILWIGTLQSGLNKCIIDDKTGDVKFKSYKNNKGASNQISNNEIRVLLEDSENLLWIGTLNGLNCYDRETGIFQNYFCDKNDTCSLSDNIINSIVEDKNKTIWIGTNMGLNKLIRNGPGAIFKRYTATDGMKNDLINAILEDDKGHLWISTNGGLSKFDPETGKFSGIVPGQTPGNIIYGVSVAHKNKQGQLFFGGANGFCAFFPDKLKTYKNIPKIVITDLKIANTSVKPGQVFNGRVILNTNVTDVKEITLTPKEHLFSFEFASLDFTAPSENEYAYMLEGFDDEWNEIGNNRVATYTRVPHGKYIFRVKGSNSYGIWNNEGIEIKLNIKPPWWKSSLAYLFYILLTLSMIYLFKKYSIINANEKSKLLLEKALHEKDNEVHNLKVAFFTNISHELRTPLTLIMGPIEEMISKKGLPAPDKKMLLLMRRNAMRLYRLINQLLELRKAETGKIKLYARKIEITSFIFRIFESFKDLAVSLGIDYKFENPGKEIYAWVDLDKLDKIIFNLLSNAFKFTKQEGKIAVKIHQGDENIYIEVTDDGIGMAREHLDHIFERFYQVGQGGWKGTGIGLSLTKTFVELHKGEINVTSEVGKGSCFTIKLKSGDEHLHSDEKIESDDENAVETKTLSREKFFAETFTCENLGPSHHDQRLKNILLVDDNIDMLLFIKQRLQYTYNIYLATNGKLGLEQAKQINPDLIISDIMMPEMDGVEFCKQLKTNLETSHIPVMLLTAKKSAENENQGLSTGAIDYIVKPFNMKSLVQKIENNFVSRKKIVEKYRKDLFLRPKELTITSVDEQLIQKVVAIIDQNIDNTDLNVEWLCNKLGLGTDMVYRKIKAYTGRSVNDFIRGQRLKAAASLLYKSHCSINDVGYKVGFTSPSYFSKCFKEAFGKTPKDFAANDKNC